MKKATFWVGALAAMLALPTTVKADQVVIKGSVLDRYYYGKDIHSSDVGWFQQYVGGVEGVPNYFGLGSLTYDSSKSVDNYPISFDMVVPTWVLYGNSGAVYTGDAYYTFFQHETDNSQMNMEQELGSEEWETVVRKWNLTSGTYENWGVIPYSFTDMTYDPVYDRIYAVGYLTRGEESGYKLCEIDLSEKNNIQVKFISREAMQITSELRCLAINSKGQLYGLDYSGNFYKVNKKNGALTQIGNVGFKSQERMMSATFDLRNDKLYWLGYMNDGKIPGSGTSGTNTTLSIADGGRDTGLFEINTETGVATLLGSTDGEEFIARDQNGKNPQVMQYGKFMLSGIYVEGSFTKPTYDQRIELSSVPVQMNAGETAAIKVKVKNLGSEDVWPEDYKVNFYANGVLIGTPRSRDLDKGMTREFEIEYTAPNNAGSVRIYAELVNENDQQPLNNRTDDAYIVVISDKVLPTVTLKGEQDGNRYKLTWSDPDGHITEGAENYAPFTYDNLGMWKMVDGDQANTQRPSSYNMAVDYANWNTPKAYIVFNPEQAGIYLTGSAEQFQPHNGEQYFAAFYSAVQENGSGHYVDNDDWMISPLLNGKSQTISFWAKGYAGSTATGYVNTLTSTEKILVAWSNTDNNVTSFANLTDTVVVNSDEWTQYSFTLPEGARYFAIHCVSKADEGFVLMVDDIEMNIQAQPVTGYKVYKNGNPIATFDAETNQYAATRAASSDQFFVTALYGNDESEPSNIVGPNVVTAIQNAETATAETGTPRFYNVNGQQVNGTRRPGLYVIQHQGKTRKVVIR